MPYYFFLFLSNLDEYWWIYNPNYGINDLVIEILEIDVEKAPDCKYDRIIIYEGNILLSSHIYICN